MRYSQRLALKNETPYSASSRTTDESDESGGILEKREEDLQRGEISDREYLGRGLIPDRSVLFRSCAPWSCSRLYGSRPVRDLSGGVAISEECPDPDRPPRSMQCLGKAGDGDRVPAGECEIVVRSKRRLKDRPADLQHLITLGARCLDLLCVLRYCGAVARQRVQVRRCAANERDQAGSCGRSFRRPVS